MRSLGRVQVLANGIDVSCHVTGDRSAPPLLCLHSLATDHAIWDAQVPALDRRFWVIRPDLRGHGATQVTEPPYTLELLVQDAVALLDALEVDQAAVMGLSIGGLIAMGMALDAPDRLERIVVADCRADAPPAYVALWDGVVATALERGVEPVVDASLERWFSPRFRAGGAPVVDRVRARALRTPVDGLVGCARAVQSLAYLPRLQDIDVPTLFVVGSEDPAAPPETMRDMASRVPDAEFVVLPGAGHLTPAETGDDFTAAVLPFLERQ